MLIANEDLTVAKLTIKAEIYSSAAYHCQQAAEKALKAYLAYQKQPPLKTHDLVKLTKLCAQFEKNFEQLLDAAILLSPFATKFRYPSEFDIPDNTDTKYALKMAKTIVSFVDKKLLAQETEEQSAIFK